MKVAHLNTVGGQGSIPKLIYNIEKYSKNSCHYLIFGNNYSVLKKQKSFKVSNLFFRYINALSARIFDNDGFFGRRNSKRIIQYIRKLDPDLVHIHNIHGYWADLSTIINFLKKEKIKVIWTLHDYWLLTGRCAYFDHNSCSKWLTGCGSCQFLDAYPATLYDRSARNYIRKEKLFDGLDFHFVLPSYFARGYFDKSHLARKKRSVVYNGIDLSLNNNSKIKEKKKKIGAIANKWSDLKGIGDIIKLSPKLKSNYTIEIVGKGIEKSLFENYKNIYFREEIKCERDLISFYRSCDVIFNPSYAETFGLVLAESLAQRTPAVAYKLDAFQEIYQDYNYIKLFSQGDIESILIGIYSFCEKELSSDKWTEDHLKLKQLSAKNLAKNYENIYFEVLKK